MAHVVSGYANVIAIRHKISAELMQFAAASNVPVINAGDGSGEHPTQALTDLYALQTELAAKGKTIDGTPVAVVGDLLFGRAAHSFVKTLSLFENISFVFAAPARFRLSDSLRRFVEQKGHAVCEVASIATALEGVDAIYMTRYQVERHPWWLRKSRTLIRLDKSIYDTIAPQAVILHPLPRDQHVGELSTTLDADPHFAPFRQSDGGVTVRMALFARPLVSTHFCNDTYRPSFGATPVCVKSGHQMVSSRGRSSP